MTSSQPSDPRHSQLRDWYDQFTKRIAAVDKDLGRELDSERKLVLSERQAELVADRELVAAYLDALERDRPLPGPWPPAFETADLLPSRPAQVSLKAGCCDFYRHIPLPPNYIPRPELLAEVRAALLADT